MFAPAGGLSAFQEIFSELKRRRQKLIYRIVLDLEGLSGFS
jgi:hypothetical protein